MPDKGSIDYIINDPCPTPIVKFNTPIVKFNPSVVNEFSGDLQTPRIRPG